MEGGGAAVQDRRLIAVNKILLICRTPFSTSCRRRRDLNAINLGQGFRKTRARSTSGRRPLMLS
jgi:hypothetical protein